MVNKTNKVELILSTVEQELQAYLETSELKSYPGLRDILAYSMGWDSQILGEKRGKRIRPLLTCLCAWAGGGEWRLALPFACAIEFIHNFSLIHDDIEDRSTMRRGRPAVWVKYGLAQALNAGDAMFALAHHVMFKADALLPPSIVQAGFHIFESALINLTGGQFLDIDFEKRDDVLIDDYYKMIAGKTAALLGCSAQLGSIVAGAGLDLQTEFYQLGYNLGMAFQIQDDYLGIWGESEITGKSIESDLITGKKSLPILFGLQMSPDFAERWKKGNIQPNEVPLLADILARDGAQRYTADKATDYSLKAYRLVELWKTANEPAQYIIDLIQSLLGRKK